LHVLELIAWLCNCALALPDHYARNSTGMDAAGSMEIEGPTRADCISKEQAYTLLAALQELECSFAADELMAAGAPDAELLKTLRLSLLGLLCAATIQHNAQRASASNEGVLLKSLGREQYYGRERISLARQSRFLRQQHSHKREIADSKLQGAMAFELLTGASVSFE
jgi:hypothetical protein